MIIRGLLDHFFLSQILNFNNYSVVAPMALYGSEIILKYKSFPNAQISKIKNETVFMSWGLAFKFSY